MNNNRKGCGPTKKRVNKRSKQVGANTESVIVIYLGAKTLMLRSSNGRISFARDGSRMATDLQARCPLVFARIRQKRGAEALA